MSKTENDCIHFDGKFCDKGTKKNRDDCMMCGFKIIEKHLYDIKKHMRQYDKTNYKRKPYSKTSR